MERVQHRYTLLYQFSRGCKLLESEERKMFKLRVQYLDGQVNDVVADNNTLVLLETMMRYGIIARLTCKLR